MTADYREEYDKLFEVIKDNAPRPRPWSTAEVVASGIVRSGEDRVDGPGLRQPADHQQADQGAGGLQGPGHRDHAEGRRRLAGRRPGHLARRRLNSFCGLRAACNRVFVYLTERLNARVVA